MTSQQIQYGGQPPYWKSYFGYISHELLSDWRDIWYVLVEPCSDTWHVTKIAIFENSRWRTAAILTMVSSLYLSRGSFDFNEIWSSTADFGSKDGHVTKYQNFANSKWRTAAILKSFFDNISTIYCTINVKFDTKSRITFWYRSRDQNTKIWKFKMADDRHFENGFITISQLRIIWFQFRCIIWLWERSIIKVSKFCKFKMADGRFVCERLYVGLQISQVFWVNRRRPPILIVIQRSVPTRNS